MNEGGDERGNIVAGRGKVEFVPDVWGERKSKDSIPLEIVGRVHGAGFDVRDGGGTGEGIWFARGREHAIWSDGKVECAGSRLGFRDHSLAGKELTGVVSGSDAGDGLKRIEPTRSVVRGARGEGATGCGEGEGEGNNDAERCGIGHYHFTKSVS